MMEKGYALITGASKGIGKEVALQLAAQGWPLLLVARSAELLQALKQEIEARDKVSVQVFAADLAKPEVPGQILDFCHAHSIGIQILVNNAGFGVWDKFEHASWAEMEGMNALNVTALLRMCHTFIPMLRQNQRAYILNVSSLGAFQPIPYMALYGAGKAYVRSFSFALRDELRDSPISVTCLSPGGVHTDFPERAGSQLVVERNGKMVMAVDRCVRKALRAMFRGRAEVIPGWYNHIGMWASKLLPTTFSAAMARRIMMKPE